MLPLGHLPQFGRAPHAALSPRASIRPSLSPRRASPVSAAPTTPHRAPPGRPLSFKPPALAPRSPGRSHVPRPLSARELSPRAASPRTPANLLRCLSNKPPPDYQVELPRRSLRARGEISLQELDERLGRFELMNVTRAREAERHAREAEQHARAAQRHAQETAVRHAQELQSTRDAFERTQQELRSTQQELRQTQSSLRELRDSASAADTQNRSAGSAFSEAKSDPKLSAVNESVESPPKKATLSSPPKTPPPVMDRAARGSRTPAFGPSSPAMSPVEVNGSPHLFQPGSPPTFHDHENEDPNAPAFSPVKSADLVAACAVAAVKSPAKALRWPTNGNPMLASPHRAKALPPTAAPTKVLTARVGGGFHFLEVEGAYRDPRTGMEHPAGRVQASASRGRTYFVVNHNTALATCRLAGSL